MYFREAKGTKRPVKESLPIGGIFWDLLPLLKSRNQEELFVPEDWRARKKGTTPNIWKIRIYSQTEDIE